MPSPSTRIDTATLDTWLHDAADIHILDVRTPAEFETVHIPGAYNVPLDTIGEHATEIQRHVEQPVVVVCRSGNRAGQAEQRLLAAGMSNVKVLDGGMIAWERSFGTAPGRLNRGRARWDLERQVRLVAGTLVLASIVASVWVPGIRYLAGLIGAGLATAALTNSCLIGSLLARLPYNHDAACDVDRVVAQLIRAGRATPPGAGAAT